MEKRRSICRQRQSIIQEQKYTVKMMKLQIQTMFKTIKEYSRIIKDLQRQNRHLLQKNEKHSSYQMLYNNLLVQNKQLSSKYLKASAQLHALKQTQFKAQGQESKYDTIISTSVLQKEDMKQQQTTHYSTWYDRNAKKIRNSRNNKIFDKNSKTISPRSQNRIKFRKTSPIFEHINITQFSSQFKQSNRMSQIQNMFEY